MRIQIPQHFAQYDARLFLIPARFYDAFLTLLRASNLVYKFSVPDENIAQIVLTLPVRRIII